MYCCARLVCTEVFTGVRVCVGVAVGVVAHSAFCHNDSWCAFTRGVARIRALVGASVCQQTNALFICSKSHETAHEMPHVFWGIFGVGMQRVVLTCVLGVK